MNLKVIKSEKFKDVKITINFLSKVDENCLYKYLLADLLGNSCKKYPTKKEATNKLSSLYGANLLSQASIEGEGVYYTFGISAINNNYVKDIDLLEEEIELISEYLLRPKLSNGKFDEKEFIEAKRIGNAKFLRKKDKPSSYAVFKGLEIIGKNQAAGIIPQFLLNKYNGIQNEDLYKYYLNMLNNDRVDVIVVGDVDETRVLELFNRYFDFNNNSDEVYSKYKFNVPVVDDMYYEYKDIDQTYLSLYYHVDIQKGEKDYYAYVIGNHLLGLSPSSLLFQEVREKNSLCYSISSIPSYFDQLMYITTGIQPENIDKTIELCIEQVEKVKKGEFSDELLNTSKLMILNSLKSEQDSSSQLLSRAYNDVLSFTKFDYERIKNEIEAVTKNDIINAFKKVNYISGFILGKENATWKK